MFTGRGSGRKPTTWTHVRDVIEAHANPVIRAEKEKGQREER